MDSLVIKLKFGQRLIDLKEVFGKPGYIIYKMDLLDEKNSPITWQELDSEGNNTKVRGKVLITNETPLRNEWGRLFDAPVLEDYVKIKGIKKLHPKIPLPFRHMENILNESLEELGYKSFHEIACKNIYNMLFRYYLFGLSCVLEGTGACSCELEIEIEKRFNECKSKNFEELKSRFMELNEFVSNYLYCLKESC